MKLYTQKEVLKGLRLQRENEVGGITILYNIDSINVPTDDEIEESANSYISIEGKRGSLAAFYFKLGAQYVVKEIEKQENRK